MGRMVRLAERPDWRTASALAQDLMACRGDDVVIDASTPAEPSALVLEIVLAAAAQWRSDGRDLRLANPSAAFTDTCHVLGLDVDSLAMAPHA